MEAFELGDLGTNAYLAYRTGEPDAAATVFDPGQRPGPLLARIRGLGLAVERVVLTHAHADHIAGLAELRDLHPGCAIEIHAAETAYLQDPENNLSAWIGQPLVAPAATGTLAGGTTTRAAGLDWAILATPGHSPGGLTFHQQELGLAIVGDTLFAGGVGRTDFPHSDPAALQASLRQLMTLPEDTRVLPGHGPETTVGRERAGNPFL
ncbi:putative hydrolase [Phycisphaera mikurensis NBRC 102666]|uniref:Putative hydrolase n=1 Tax=Phycisphaera mikurensis (strain NBRC 102666 / KCTC 22515 / FYK2301M01) TaxID=1142394 RepID=I0IIG6_PHYMF|nr:putative hydrolase [Phycisphaera mikurensis NBRC 102666]